MIFLSYKWLRCKYFDIRPRTWWKYAGNATLHTIKERNKKLTKKFLVQRARDVCAYYRVYSNYLETHVLNAENTVSVHDRQLYLIQYMYNAKQTNFTVKKCFNDWLGS